MTQRLIFKGQVIACNEEDKRVKTTINFPFIYTDITLNWKNVVSPESFSNSQNTKENQS